MNIPGRESSILPQGTANFSLVSYHAGTCSGSFLMETLYKHHLFQLNGISNLPFMHLSSHPLTRSGAKRKCTEILLCLQHSGRFVCVCVCLILVEVNLSALAGGPPASKTGKRGGILGLRRPSELLLIGYIRVLVCCRERKWTWNPPFGQVTQSEINTYFRGAQF